MKKIIKDYSGKKIKIMQEVTESALKDVEILRSATIPSWCGGCWCAICKDEINEDTQVSFTIPYHIEYAHIKCFQEATNDN